MSNINWIPASIKASVLSDVINWKTIEKSYEDLCKFSRQKIISVSSHQLLFDAFLKESCNISGTQTNINEIMFNELIYIRYRILQDVISKVSINTSYKGLCEMIENVSYPEFEFWYYRFHNGQRELDYDRSNDPKQLKFYGLPTDVVKKVVDKLDVKSRSNLRSVSRGLKSFVDSSSLKVEKITFLVHFSIISVFVDDVKKLFYCQDHLLRRRSVFPVGSLTSKACRHLSIFIGNPKLQLGNLDINFNSSWPENMLVDKVFRSLTHKLHIGGLKLIGFTQQNLLEIILCVKPKILKKIEIEYLDAEPEIFNNLIESEQWKQAEEVIIFNSMFFNISHFFHFKRFNIFLETASMDRLLGLRDGISKSSNFEWCRLKILDGPSDEEIQRDLELKKQVHDNMEYIVYNIPNSTETLVFSFFDIEIFIKKSNNFAGF